MSVSTDTVFVHKAWHDNSPSIKKITYPMVADPTAQLCQYFGTYIEGAGLSLRGKSLVLSGMNYQKRQSVRRMTNALLLGNLAR